MSTQIKPETHRKAWVASSPSLKFNLGFVRVTSAYRGCVL